nr:unnamed protein product [Callosobruchus analis]
MVYPFKY